MIHRSSREHSTKPLALDVEGLTVTYGKEPALWNADVRLGRGALAAVVGPNGAGKSTLLKAALGVVPRVSGRVRVLGEDPARRRRLVAYVPQRTSVDWDFPTTVLDVVMMGTYGRLGWFRRPGRNERALALGALEQMELADLAGRQISELSGGQQQRVFLARALVQDAEVYFMDEPFAGVDAVTEQSIASLLGHLAQRGKTILSVHHDLATVPRYFEHAVLLNRAVQAVGTVKEVFHRGNLDRLYGGRVPADVPELAST